MMKKKYKAEAINVVWKPELCIHSGVCVKMLPKVYDPQKRPWIEAENASDAELMAQIKKCPSGALTFEKISEV